MEAIKIFTERHDLKIESVVYSFAGLGNCVNELRDLGINKIRLFCPRVREKIIVDDIINRINSEIKQPIVPSAIKPGQSFKKPQPVDIETYPFALGSTEIKLPMYLSVNDNGESNSTLKWMKHKELYPAIHQSGMDKVNFQRLDKLFECEPFSLLYLNQNGYEIEALRGASDILPCYDYIIVPIFRANLYENTPKICEIADHLDQIYRMVDFCNVHRDKRIDKYRSFALFARCGLVKSFDSSMIETIIDWSRAARPFDSGADIIRPDFEKPYVKIELNSASARAKSQYSTIKPIEKTRPSKENKIETINTELIDADEEIDESAIIHPFTVDVPVEFRPTSSLNPFPEYFLKKFIQTKFSSNPVKRKFLPIFWNEIYEKSGKGQYDTIIKRLVQYLSSLPKNTRYFTINDCPIKFLPESVFSGIDIDAFSPYSENPELWMPELFPPIFHHPMNRDLFASFCGNTSESELVADMVKEFNEEKEIETLIANVNTRKSQELIASTMCRSIFALCPESENTYSTFRISAALQYGAIPVLITEKATDIFVNDDFILKYTKDQKVNELLKNISVIDIYKMLNAGKTKYKEFYSYSSWFNKIVKRLQEEEGTLYLKRVPNHDVIDSLSPIITPDNTEENDGIDEMIDASNDVPENEINITIDHVNAPRIDMTDKRPEPRIAQNKAEIKRFDWND